MDQNLLFEPEELLPLVTELTQKYTSYERVPRCPMRRPGH